MIKRPIKGQREIAKARWAGPTGSAGAIRSLFEALIRSGVTPETLQRITGLSLRVLDDPDARVPLTQLAPLIGQIGTLTHDPAIGLKLGMDPDTVYPSGLAWGIMRNSPTLGLGIERFARFIRILSEFLSIELLNEADEVVVFFHIDPPSFELAFPIELMLARFLTTVRQILGQRFYPKRTTVRHARPDHAPGYYQLFGPEMRFDQPCNSLVLPAERLSNAIIRRDIYLERLLLRHGEQLLADLTTDEPFSRQVKNLILQSLFTGEVDVEMIADRLQMSRYTLYRKLKDEAVAFQDLLQETRRELALHHLTRRELSIQEIAFLLGFAEPSTFNRAFKRWTGQSPRHYRQSQPDLMVPLTQRD
jgi:AraC-like DNA-binding protein